MTVKELRETLALFPDTMTIKVACDKYVRDVQEVTNVVDMGTNITSVEIVAEDKPSLARLMNLAGYRYYQISDIKPKSGNLREVHQSALGRPCYIVSLDPGERGMLMFKPDYDPDEWHRLHLSTIQNVTDDNGIVSIETRNTVYILQPV